MSPVSLVPSAGSVTAHSRGCCPNARPLVLLTPYVTLVLPDSPARLAPFVGDISQAVGVGRPSGS